MVSLSVPNNTNTSVYAVVRDVHNVGLADSVEIDITGTTDTRFTSTGKFNSIDPFNNEGKWSNISPW